MFYEIVWVGIDTYKNLFCQSFDKAVEIAKQYTNDEQYLLTYDLYRICTINKYEIDTDTELYKITEEYSYDADTDELTNLTHKLTDL